LIGRIVEVKITQARTWHLMGEYHGWVRKNQRPPC
jgi:hypothetical protein